MLLQRATHVMTFVIIIVRFPSSQFSLKIQIQKYLSLSSECRRAKNVDGLS